MNDILKNARYALRMMMRNPAFTSVAVLALAIGIGANTAIFTVVDALVLRPLPFPNSSKLVLVWERSPQMDFVSVAYPNFLDWRKQQTSFEGIAAAQPESFILTSTGRAFSEPERLSGSNVSHDLFDVLGVAPRIGRPFTAAEDAADSHVVLISHNLWERRYGRDPNVLGKQLRLSAADYTIIGVMPQGFTYPLSGVRTDVWAPLGRNERQPNMTNRGNHPGIYVVGRLKPGVTLEQARADFARVAANLAAQYPDVNKLQGIGSDLLQSQVSGSLRTAGFIVLGAVVFVLLIACANVANLLLARASSRSHEIAVRTALGAGRRHIVQQLLTESLLLSLFSGLVGLLLAYWGVDALRTMIPDGTPRAETISIDGRVLAFTLLVSLATGVIFGLAPALHAASGHLHDTVKEGGKRSIGSESRQRWRNALIVGEVAMSLILLVGAGLMIQSFLKLSATSPGIDPDNVATASITLRGESYKEPPQLRSFADRLLAQMRHSPGVDKVAITTFLPLFSSNQTSLYIEGQPNGPHDRVMSDWLKVSPEYFSAMRIALKEGRTFNEYDRETSPRVAVVDETFAKRFFPDGSAVGKKIYHGPTEKLIAVEIVGIVDHVKHYGVDQISRFEAYIPYAQEPSPNFSLVVRANTDAAAVMPAMRAAVAGVDRDVPLFNQSAMRDLLTFSMISNRISTVLFGVFAGVAILLSAIGIYGLISYSVTQRTQEIGVRIALGARSGDVLRLVFGQGGLLIGLGVLIGIAGSAALTRLLTAFLFNISATDVKTFLAAPVLLALIAALATYIPARRAMRVDPMQALRYE